MLRLLAIALVAGASLLASPAMAFPVTVQSVLFDYDGNVLTVGPAATDPSGNAVINGDFTILQAPGAVEPTVGDGIDDWTRGIFDFRGDPAYAQFITGGTITAATLSLVLSPVDGLFSNDQFNLENGPFTGSPEIGNQLYDNAFLENGISKIVTLNLLNYFTSEQLMNFLSGGTGDFLNDGRIVFTYGDDTIVSGAMMQLTAVPEPPTLALVGVALAGFGAARRRKVREGVVARR
jgi:hypothetical protein